MGRRLGLSLLALGTGVALLVSAAFAGPHGDTRRGGTLRVMFGAEPDSVDPALATGSIGSWTLLYATCAKLFNTLPDPDTGRRRIAPEVVRSFPDVSNDGRTYTFELRRTSASTTACR
jgi:ABC-type oligopeptide transport system substrate-binding subunit